jgi:hypothetical protein
VAIKIDRHISLQDTPKFAQIGMFCLKINHLATLSGQNFFPAFFRVFFVFIMSQRFPGIGPQKILPFISIKIPP